MTVNAESEWFKVTEDLPKSVSDEWWAKITKKYGETGRDAHDLCYLQRKLDELDDECRSYLSNLKAFILALFFQFFHYDPMDSDCCAKNLESFECFSEQAGIKDGALFNDVKNLLEASSVYSTEEHKIEGAYGENDAHYFLDLDLMCLGLDSEAYQEHANDIAKEYSTLDSNSYKKLRQRVLRSFLLIPNIFATKLFREKYEVQARNNIQTELDGL